MKLRDYPVNAEYFPYESWHSEVVRIFKEEDLTYSLDSDAIVHPYVDAVFESNRTSAP